MRILSFDQATSKTGYALFEGDNMIEYGLLERSKKDLRDTDLRCRSMALAICEKIKDCQPDVVVIEDVALHRNAKTLIQLARIQGEIMGYCDMIPIPVVILAPAHWRKALSFVQAKKQRVDLKAEAQQFVTETFGLYVKDDVADAICMGYVVWKNQQEYIKEESNHE